MATNMAELAKNMEELDKESATLFNRLGSLEADLREETSNFDEKVPKYMSMMLFFFGHN